MSRMTGGTKKPTKPVKVTMTGGMKKPGTKKS